MYGNLRMTSFQIMEKTKVIWGNAKIISEFSHVFMSQRLKQIMVSEKYSGGVNMTSII